MSWNGFEQLFSALSTNKNIYHITFDNISFAKFSTSRLMIQNAKLRQGVDFVLKGSLLRESDLKAIYLFLGSNSSSVAYYNPEEAKRLAGIMGLPMQKALNYTRANNKSTFALKKPRCVDAGRNTSKPELATNETAPIETLALNFEIKKFKLWSTASSYFLSNSIFYFPTKSPQQTNENNDAEDIANLQSLTESMAEFVLIPMR